MGDRKSLFFTFIFEKKVVPSSNLVYNFTIKYSFGKVIEMFCSPSKFYWHLHFFCKNQSSLRKADEAISWITLVLQVTQQRNQPCLKATHVQFSTILVR